MRARATSAPDPATGTLGMVETASRTKTPIPLSACIGLVILAAYAAVMIVGPYFAPYSTGEIISVKSYAPQSDDAFLGTDALGRDLLSRMLHGARLTGVGLVWKIEVIDLVRFWCRDGRPKTAIRDNGPLQGRILSRRQGRAGEGGNAPHRQKRYESAPGRAWPRNAGNPWRPSESDENTRFHSPRASAL